MAQRCYTTYFKNFKWHHMGPGLHKLLVHVPQLQELLPYPISFSTEEAVESVHKIIRRAIREGVFTGSPETVMLGLWQKLSIRGDPKVARLYKYPEARMAHRELPAIVKSIILM